MRRCSPSVELVSDDSWRPHDDPHSPVRMAPDVRFGKPAIKGISTEALWEHDQGARLTAAEAMAASVERTAFHQHALTLFERVDFLALPTTQVWPFPVEWRWPKEIAGRAMDTYHRWMEVVIVASIAGLPCVSVPAGFDARGLPMGLQLIGRPRGDRELLRLAAAYEAAAAEVLAVRPPEPRLR